jgi:hypothetical protein
MIADSVLHISTIFEEKEDDSDSECLKVAQTFGSNECEDENAKGFKERLSILAVRVNWLTTGSLEGRISICVVHHWARTKNTRKNGCGAGIAPHIFEHQIPSWWRCLVHVLGLLSKIKVVIWVRSELECFVRQKGVQNVQMSSIDRIFQDNYSVAMKKCDSFRDELIGWLSTLADVLGDDN